VHDVPREGESWTCNKRRWVIDMKSYIFQHGPEIDEFAILLRVQFKTNKKILLICKEGG
jgi:hypothetical protein